MGSDPGGPVMGSGRGPGAGALAGRLGGEGADAGHQPFVPEHVDAAFGGDAADAVVLA
jgi:hypothetical protein